MWALWGVQSTTVDSDYPVWASVSGLYLAWFQSWIFVLFYKYTFQLCCALCLCVTDRDTDISSLLHADKTSVGMHVKVCFEKTVRTNIFSSLDKHWFCLYWLLLSVRKSGYNGCLWYPQYGGRAWWCKLNERLANVMQIEAMSCDYFLLAHKSYVLFCKYCLATGS